MFYKPLTRADVGHIVELLTADINSRLAQKGLSCVLTPAARELVIENAYDPLYGARPLRRYLQHTVETLISRAIIAGEVAEGQTLTVDGKDGALTLDISTALQGVVVEDRA